MLYNKSYRKKRIDINAINYYNANGQKDSFFSDYKLILCEIKLLGYEPSDLSLEQIKSSISQLLLDNYMKINFEGKHECNLEKEKKIKYYVLYSQLKELTYWLYDFDLKKMPYDTRLDFKFIN